MNIDARMMIMSGLLSLMPFDAITPQPSRAVLFVGDGEEDAGEEGGDARPADADASQADLAEWSKAAAAYLEARKARVEAEAKRRPPDLPKDE